MRSGQAYYASPAQQQLKHQYVINIIFLLNSKHSTILATMKKINSIIAKASTDSQMGTSYDLKVKTVLLVSKPYTEALSRLRNDNPIFGNGNFQCQKVSSIFSKQVNKAKTNKSLLIPFKYTNREFGQELSFVKMCFQILLPAQNSLYEWPTIFTIQNVACN